ncbi:hypothetical protein GGTG_08164 [Gaeumannomyces tritici R3-111a-1]|uniref:GTP-binding protein SAR1 n=1 Tax=Gaeumannomyces tritici (strain R3-111a-1) TaxID=644352 RepID=J3P3S9_GAET3|nr:hypothetical protein GGTG_08164 [Gaeumannomyces tritici R3-111a-1]EJT74323.1 hypothetical protein GGTG_08164 [Gaeumannomyces tritici R3-111a-1]
MQNHKPQDFPSASLLALHAITPAVASKTEEEPSTDADEPPDERPLGLSPTSKRFQKAIFRPVPECYPSLLTKALQSHSEDDSLEGREDLRPSSRRRRSLASNISVASTADLSCDTALTTPARTSSPSPRLPQESFATVDAGLDAVKVARQTGVPQNGEKKRCISFACAAAPQPRAPTEIVTPKPVPTIVAPKRPCIKFACDAGKTDAPQKAAPKTRASGSNVMLSAAPRKIRSPSTNSRSNRSATPRRSTENNATVRFRNFLSASPNDLKDEASRFHEFATDEVQEDDWIRQDTVNAQRRLTIEDTLQMELAISRLGKEAEEEAEQEEADAGEADQADNADDVDDEDGDDGDDADLDDAWAGYGSDHESSDGYRTDEEDGFAESDDDDDDGLVLWSTSGHSAATRIPASSFQRRVSISELSDSSAFSPGHATSSRRKMSRSSPRNPVRPDTPDLPDSTDFVCGTLDEDRPLEEAYLTCINARKTEKLRLIPQDIDPSFPTSEPEDEDDASFRPLHRNSEEHVWLHGEIEGLDVDDDHVERPKKKLNSPKRLHSPPPRARGRSPPPRRLFDRHSPPRRLRSPPPPQATVSPHASPIHGGQRVVFKALAFRPGLTHTKSLPRAPALMGHLKSSHHRKRPAPISKEGHVRGAIDIVKGLEHRRQRRREKFKEKQCNRARKGLAQERRPQPGKGAERMRELGLLMAGKLSPKNYVLSV